MITDSFRNDLVFFIEQIELDDPFSLSRWGDGELKILQGRPITARVDNWSFDPDKHSWLSEWLMEAYKYEHKDYYKGISCPCCDPSASDWYRSNIHKNLTWANIFVNSNFPYFQKHFWEAINKSKREIILVANEKLDELNIPFTPHDIIRIGYDDAFNQKRCIDIIRCCKSYVFQSDKIFLFAAGPLSNLLAFELQFANRDNFYIDIGSVLNNAIRPNSRDYLAGGDDLRKTCIW